MNQLRTAKALLLTGFLLVSANAGASLLLVQTSNQSTVSDGDRPFVELLAVSDDHRLMPKGESFGNDNSVNHVGFTTRQARRGPTKKELWYLGGGSIFTGPIGFIPPGQIIPSGLMQVANQFGDDLVNPDAVAAAGSLVGQPDQSSHLPPNRPDDGLAAVPVPAAAWLMVSGMFMLMGFRRS